MSRPKTPDGKRVTLSTKVSEAKADAVNRKRGSLTRAAYLEALIDADLAPPIARKTAPRRSGPPVAAGLAQGRAADQRAGNCQHPKSRVHKGLCGACGTHVG